MFELEKSSPFFERMSADHPEIVQNIEIVHENCTMMDVAYHRPKTFILALNNLLRSLLFFVEFAVKNSPAWLADAVNAQRNHRLREHEILKHLRNVSAHQRLVFPDESLVSGLFRVRSDGTYTLKLGQGDHRKPGKYSLDLTLRNTVDIFHDLLVFDSLVFMDLEHCAIGECLGITRRWFFSVKFKNQTERFDEVVDVYQLISDYAGELLDRVCEAYAAHVGMKSDYSFSRRLGEHNFINTLLEVDLYPQLFSEWWGEEVQPLNCGVFVERYEGDVHSAREQFHGRSFQHLCADASAYRGMLERIVATSLDELLARDDAGDVISFIQLNHWHFKRSFGHVFDVKHINPSDVLILQRIGNAMFEEHRKGKECTIHAAKGQLDAQCKKMLEKLDAAA